MSSACLLRSALLGAALGLAASSVVAQPDASLAGAQFGRSLVGTRFVHEVVRGDSLASLAARYGQSAASIARDNALQPGGRLALGTTLALDNRHVVPESAEDDILINVPQRMLFHFVGGRLLAAHPVTVGRRNWRTPLGEFTVINRQTDKPWFVPKSIQEEMLREGKPVLTRVEPGPSNPLGRHWIGLSMPAIGIHGTNAPTSIYALRSHGCIRMHPDDIAALFDRVQVGTPGRIIYRPTLLAALPDGRIFVEANRDEYGLGSKPLPALRTLAESRGLTERIDWAQVALVIAARDGIARDVTAQAIVPQSLADAPARAPEQPPSAAPPARIPFTSGDPAR